LGYDHVNATTHIQQIEKPGVTAMRTLIIGMVILATGLLAGCGPDILLLDIGTCFDDPTEFDLVDSSDVPIVECDTPHDNEVFANEQLTGDDFPGRQGIANRADQACLAVFDNYVGAPYESSIYEFSWFVPSDESWEIGDREVICFAYDLSFEKITGSINGIGR
jgi:hypothetical protein